MSPSAAPQAGVASGVEETHSAQRISYRGLNNENRTDKPGIRCRVNEMYVAKRKGNINVHTMNREQIIKGNICSRENNVYRRTKDENSTYRQAIPCRVNEMYEAQSKMYINVNMNREHGIKGHSVL